MKMRTHVQAGGFKWNHNHKLVLAKETIRSLKIKTAVKAGAPGLVHLSRLC